MTTGRPTYSEALQRRAVALVNQGWRSRDVAQLLRVSQSAVTGWVRERRRTDPVETPEAVRLLQRVMVAWREE